MVILEKNGDNEEYTQLLNEQCFRVEYEDKYLFSVHNFSYENNYQS